MKLYGLRYAVGCNGELLERLVTIKPTELRPLMTRIPEALRKRLARAAKVNDRSMNAEIIHRLEESFIEKPLLLTGPEGRALREIAAAMQFMTLALDGTPWQQDRIKVEAVLTAAHVILSALANPSVEKPTRNYDDPTVESTPAERALPLTQRFLDSIARLRSYTRSAPAPRPPKTQATG